VIGECPQWVESGHKAYAPRSAAEGRLGLATRPHSSQLRWHNGPLKPRTALLGAHRACEFDRLGQAQLDTIMTLVLICASPAPDDFGVTCDRALGRVQLE
jgi:hypothetical protein